ncbi:MAG: NAD(P)H-binding protein [Sulfitobacter sp.]
MGKVIVLGAKGRFGRAAVEAFAQSGWDVTAFGRNWTSAAPEGVARVSGDAFDPAALTAACAGMDVIVNALHAPYENWVRDLPKLTSSVIAAARHAGAAVMIPGNVYNYGADAPVRLSEKTQWHPTSRKGQLRVEMEQAYRSAQVRTIVLRGGDYLERAKSGNWFDSQIAVKAQQGRTLYPGPLDQVHAWAYLPDMARAAVMLAERRAEFASFEEFGFEGYSLTGQALVDQIAQAVGKPQKIKSLPWPILWVLGLFQPAMREIYEMRYLWHVPHRLDGSKLARTLPDFTPTPLRDAMKDVLAA